MKWIGLTGGLGSGKSTVAQYLRQKGLAVADADRIAREVLEQDLNLRQELVQRYGPQILNVSGNVDRRALADIVFKSKSELLWLEQQIHPQVKRRVQDLKVEWKNHGQEIAFYDVPLLFEKNMAQDFDAIVLVYAPYDQRVQRVMTRDRISESSVFEKDSNQIPLDRKRQMSHFVVENVGSVGDLYLKIDQVLLELRKSLGL